MSDARETSDIAVEDASSHPAYLVTTCFSTTTMQQPTTRDGRVDESGQFYGIFICRNGNYRAVANPQLEHQKDEGYRYGTLKRHLNASSAIDEYIAVKDASSHPTDPVTTRFSTTTMQQPTTRDGRVDESGQFYGIFICMDGNYRAVANPQLKHQEAEGYRYGTLKRHLNADSAIEEYIHVLDEHIRALQVTVKQSR